MVPGLFLAPGPALRQYRELYPTGALPSAEAQAGGLVRVRRWWPGPGPEVVARWGAGNVNAMNLTFSAYTRVRSVTAGPSIGSTDQVR